MFGADDETVDDLTDEDEDGRHIPKRQRTAAEEARRARRNANFNPNGTVSRVKEKKISKVLETHVTGARVNQCRYFELLAM